MTDETSPIDDPITATAQLIGGDAALSARYREDLFEAVVRLKPALRDSADLAERLLDGRFFAALPPPLQGICQLRLECSLAFYKRVGWDEEMLEVGPGVVLSQEQIAAVRDKHTLRYLHDLSYLPPKHLEKLIGEAALSPLFERLANWVLARGAGRGEPSA